MVVEGYGLRKPPLRCVSAAAVGAHVCQHVEVSTIGLEGILPWHQARSIAATAARPLPATSARLDEAMGARLARAIATVQDDPPADAAAYDGFAVCGEGPWFVRPDGDEAALRPGEAQRLAREEPVPAHCDAVLAREAAQLERTAGTGSHDLRLLACDPLTGVPDERVRPDLGEGIVRQGTRSVAGHVTIGADSPVTAATVSHAAALGHDHLEVVRTPVVGTLVLGSHLLDRGLPRHGRVRDALGAAVPAYIGSLGARGNPAVRAPDTIDLLMAEIDDAAVDVLVTTGSTAPGPDNHLRQAMRDLQARWLVDGVAVSPGAQMLLAKLPDGRFIVGLPGQPAAALAALVTLVPPLIRGLRGEPVEHSLNTGVLVDDAPLADYADDTGLVPVRLQSTRAGTAASVVPAASGGPLAKWAAADAIAVVPPGGGRRGEPVELLPAP